MNTISFKEVALQEFDREMATTRKVLERVPFAEKEAWKPHAKSTPLGRLALHVANLAGMPVNILTQDALTFGKPGGAADAPKVATTDDLVALFDGKTKEARAALDAATDERFAGEWELAFDDGTNPPRQIFKGTRALAYRSLFMDHLIHHRAQLGVYLRLNDVEIPGSYGPSADEQ